MSKIEVSMHMPVVDGKQISFTCPKDSFDTTAIILEGEEYELVDARGRNLSRHQSSWKAGAMVSVIIDMKNKLAYVQNTAHRHFYYSPEEFITMGDPKQPSLNRVWWDLPQESLFICRAIDLTDSSWNIPENFDGILRIEKGQNNKFGDPYGTIQLVGITNEHRNYRMQIQRDTDQPTGIWYEDFTHLTVVGIPNGGTGANNVPGARKNLGFIGGYDLDKEVNDCFYTGTGDASSNSYVYNYPIGCEGSNLLFIAGPNTKGFLTPGGGVMYRDDGGVNVERFEVYGANSTQKASYANGVLKIRTTHKFINDDGNIYFYWCL